MMERKAKVERKSNETEISAELNVDGRGETSINTPVGLLNHMLTLFAFHGLFDLKVEVKKADVEIDIHHVNEDIGIVLGKVFQKALGEKEGIRRFGWASAPMEDTLANTTIDISGRGYLALNYVNVQEATIRDQDGYSTTYLQHFLESFVKGLGATVNVTITNASEDLHTTIETVFKSLGLALSQAVQVDPRRQGRIPSTKGIID